MHLRVLQWNIWYKEHAENIILFLKEVDADIVCLQELTIGHELHKGLDIPKLIGEALGFSYYFVPAHTFPTGYKIGNAIFSRYPLENHQFYYVQHASSAPEGEQEARVYIQADIVVGSERVTIATTHLSYSLSNAFDEKRLREIEQLMTQLRTKQSRFIFTGDLNAVPDSPTVQAITTHLRHCGPDLSLPTFPTKRFAPGPEHSGELQLRLDYVFASDDLAVQKASIPLTGFSDHLPVCVDFALVERRARQQ